MVVYIQLSHYLERGRIIIVMGQLYNTNICHTPQ
jgi:hypothetical protein